MFAPQLIAGSVRLHEKLFYNEDDTRTHLAAPDAGFGRCSDLAASVGVLRRNLVGTLSAGGTQWWMDLHARGWFSDAELLEEIASMGRLAEELLQGERASTSQVAVIVSKESSRYLRYDEALTDALLGRQLSELAAMGAPFEVFDASDLQRLFASPEGRNYRLVIFLDCLYLSPGERQAIREHVARDGRTLLWVYAAGLVTEDGVSTGAMADVTGIRADLWDRTWPLKAVSFLTGERVTYGTDQDVGPMLYGEDPDAVVHGWIRRWVVERPDMPGLLEKDMGEWRSIWSAAPTLPAVLLREIARRAGVHIYTEKGDQVFANPSLLAVHAACDGERTMLLPESVTVKDAFTGESVGERVNEFAIVMRRGETRVWKLAACRARGGG